MPQKEATTFALRCHSSVWFSCADVPPRCLLWCWCATEVISWMMSILVTGTDWCTLI